MRNSWTVVFFFFFFFGILLVGVGKSACVIWHMLCPDGLIIATISMKLFNMYHFQKYALLKTSSVDGLSTSSKALPKATLARKKKVMVNVWWSAPQSDPLQLSESQ